MQLIVGREWIPEVYENQLSRQFPTDLFKRLEPMLEKRKSTSTSNKGARPKKRKVKNPCLLQLTTFST